MDIGLINLPMQAEIKEQYGELRDTARTHFDMQQTRIRIENRCYASLLDTMGEDAPKRDTAAFRKTCASYYRGNPVDEDGNILPMDSLEEGTYELLVKAETFAGKALDSQMRAIVGPFVNTWLETPGIGDRTVARLLGEIGHPIVAFPCEWEEGEEGEDKRVLKELDPFVRRVSDLWAYTGHGDPERKRRAGMDQEDALALGNPRAKSLVYLMAENCKRLNGGTTSTGKPRKFSPYRNVYDAKQEHYKVARPEWTPGHRQQSCLRIVGKEILRDLYNAALADLVKSGAVESGVLDARQARAA